MEVRKLKKNDIMPYNDNNKYHIICWPDDCVVMIGSDEQQMRNEYEISQRLQCICGFIRYYNHSYIHIWMPYFPLGCLGFYNWTDIQQFRSCLKQAFLSHKNALDNGLLHGDFHAGNVLLKTTKQSQILYDDEFVIETNGLRTWIMDFENTREIARDEPKDMIDYYYDIQKFIVGLQDHRFIQKIDRASVVPLLRIISQQNQMVYPDIQFTKKILHSIDNIVFV